MLKRSVCALLAALMAMLLCLGTASAQDKDNLLVNGSFEAVDEDGMPSGWYTEAYVRQAGYTTYAVSDDAHGGVRLSLIHI